MGFFKRPRNEKRDTMPEHGYLIPRPLMTTEQWAHSYTLPSRVQNLGHVSGGERFEPLGISGRSNGKIIQTETTDSSGNQVFQRTLVIGSVAK